MLPPIYLRFALAALLALPPVCDPGRVARAFAPVAASAPDEVEEGHATEGVVSPVRRRPVPASADGRPSGALPPVRPPAARTPTARPLTSLPVHVPLRC
jgi:hypothetical protein